MPDTAHKEERCSLAIDNDFAPAHLAWGIGDAVVAWLHADRPRHQVKGPTSPVEGIPFPGGLHGYFVAVRTPLVDDFDLRSVRRWSARGSKEDQADDWQSGPIKAHERSVRPPGVEGQSGLRPGLVLVARATGLG
jgi:hypothetical protein